MLWHLFYASGLFALTYGLASLFFAFLLKKENIFDDYSLKKDPYLYMFGLFFLTAISMRLFLPDFHDTIMPVSAFCFYLPFLFSALIYLSFLFQSAKLTNILILICSFLSAFLCLKNSSPIFSNFVPLFLEKFILALLIFLMTWSSKILNKLNNVFAAFVSTFLMGVVFLSVIGGLPLSFGLTAALWIGAWIAYFQFNIYDSKILLNDGAVMSATFLLSVFLIAGANEFSFSSTLILTIYLFAELIWAVVHCFILKSKDFGEQTVYYSIYQRDATPFAIYISILKIGFVNMFLAMFQLYAPNAFTLPVLGLVINLWLLSKLYNFDKPDLSLKETNEQFIEEIKENINEMKNDFPKDTDEK